MKTNKNYVYEDISIRTVNWKISFKNLLSIFCVLFASDEMEVEEVSPTPSVPAASQPGSTTPVTVPNNQEIGTPENLADTSPVLRGEKRSLNSPSDGAPMYKRQR